jgi:hypothetical protein
MRNYLEAEITLTSKDSMRRSLFYFLLLSIIAGVVAVSIFIHSFFSISFADSLTPRRDFIAFATLAVLVYPLAKEAVRSALVYCLLGLQCTWSFSWKGILPGIRVKYVEQLVILSRTDYLCIPMIGIFFDLVVILTLGFAYQTEFSLKVREVEMSRPVGYAYFVIILAIVDLLVNLSPFAKYDFYQILSISIFKTDPREASRRIFREYFSRRSRGLPSLRTMLAMSYLILTLAYMSLVFFGIYTFVEHVYVYNEKSYWSMLFCLPVLLTAFVVYVMFFVRPYVLATAIAGTTLGLIERGPIKEAALTASLKSSYPMLWYHVPFRKFLSMSLDPNAEVDVFVGANVRPDRKISKHELQLLYDSNPRAYWNAGFGSLHRQLRKSLRWYLQLAVKYPIDSYQYLFDVAVLGGQKYHFARNLDLHQRIGFETLAEGLPNYFQKSLAQVRFIKTILPVVIRNRQTNAISAIVVSSPEEATSSTSKSRRETEYRRLLTELTTCLGYRDKRHFKRIRQLPDEFLEYAQLIPFSDNRKIAKIVDEFSAEQRSFWQTENLLSSFSGEQYLNLPYRGYLLPLRFNDNNFGLKVRSLPDDTRVPRAPHPFIEFFERRKLRIEKYNEIQDDSINFVPIDQRAYPYIYCNNGTRSPDTLYVFEGEVNAAAFTYMFDRSAIATGGLCFLQMNDIVEQLILMLKPAGIKKLVLCFDRDEKSTYYNSRIDGLKDSKFRELQYALRLQSDFEVYLPQESSVRLDNDELLSRLARNEYEQVFADTYAVLTPADQVFKEKFGNRVDRMISYLNLNYEFSRWFHKVIVPDGVGEAEEEIIAKLQSVDAQLAKLKRELFVL